MSLLTSITFILLVTQIGTVYCESYEEFVDRVLGQLCPYDTFCARNASKTLTIPERGSCCLPCSCDKTCTKRNNCCPDYIHTRDDTSPNEARDETSPNEARDETSSNEAPDDISLHATCLPAVHMKGIDTNTNEDGYYKSIRFYNTIDSCPLQFPDPTMITNYKSWELRIQYVGRSFPSTVPITQFNISTLLNNRFMLLSIPPKDHKRFISRCYRPNIVTCNETGYWGLFDSNLDRACSSYTNAYIGRVTFDLFKNPFCYLCNKNPNDAIPESCTVADDAAKSPMGEFSAIINIDSGPTQMTKNNHVCRQYEIHDPYFAVCKPLFCPIGTQPVYGRCVSVYKMSTGLALRFPIAINITINGGADSADQLLQIQNREDEEKLSIIIIQKMGLSAKRCMFCFSKLYSFDHPIFGSPFLLIAEIITTWRCSTSVLFDAVISNIDGQTFLTSLGNKSVTVTTELQYNLPTSFYHLTEVKNARYQIFASDLNCLRGLLIHQPKFYCPNIELTYKEYQQQMSGNVTGSPATYEDFVVVNIPDGQENDKNLYKICVKDYLPAEKSSSDQSPIWSLELNFLVFFHGIIAYKNV